LWLQATHGPFNYLYKKLGAHTSKISSSYLQNLLKLLNKDGNTGKNVRISAMNQKTYNVRIDAADWQRGSLLARDNTERLLNKPGPQVSQPMRDRLRHTNQ
jgi:hypothetical protein